MNKVKKKLYFLFGAQENKIEIWRCAHSTLVTIKATWRDKHCPQDDMKNVISPSYRRWDTGRMCRGRAVLTLCSSPQPPASIYGELGPAPYRRSSNQNHCYLPWRQEAGYKAPSVTSAPRVISDVRKVHLQTAINVYFLTAWQMKPPSELIRLA